MNDRNDGSHKNNSYPKKTTHAFELGTLATNRILFALALLGVVIPLNSIAVQLRQIGFIYVSPHGGFWTGPYHLRALYFFYSMEVLLAVAVYFYAFGFIFRSSIPDRIGTLFYACALLVPPLYLFTNLYSVFEKAIDKTNIVLFWILNVVVFVGGSALLLILGVMISIRLEKGNTSTNGQ